ILSSRIHRLENQQQRPLVLRIKFVLKFGKRLNTHRQSLLGLRLVFAVQIECIVRIEILQSKFLALFDNKRVRKPMGPSNDFFRLHQSFEGLAAAGVSDTLASLLVKGSMVILFKTSSAEHPGV